MRIVCQQTFLMKYHALFVIFEKRQNLKLSSAANYSGALWVKIFPEQYLHMRIKWLGFYLFVWFDFLHPINNLSVKQEPVFLGWTSTKLG